MLFPVLHSEGDEPACVVMWLDHEPYNTYIVVEFAPHFSDSSGATEKSEGNTHIVCKQENNFSWDLSINGKWLHTFATACVQRQQGAVTRTALRERFLVELTPCE